MPRPKSGYRNKNGEQVPGITTVIKRFSDTGGLIRWAFNQGKKGLDDLYEEIDRSAEIGTHAHALFEAHRKKIGAPPPPYGMSPENVMRAERAYKNALEWEQQVKVKSIATECSLVCECYQYGGTLDEIAKINGKLVDYEWKTSNGIYVDHLLQCAAQAHIWMCNHPGDLIEGAAIVRWAKDSGDFAYHYFDNLVEPFAQFVRFRQAYESDQKLRRRV